MPTIKQLQLNIEASIPEISVLAANAEVLANNDALGNVLDRIFTLGKRSDGTPIGQYKSEGYKKKRSKAGRQTTMVDFQFTGDLFNSIQVGSLNNRPAVGIVSNAKAEIADNLEKRFGVVFSASIDERDKAIEVARDYMFDGLKKIMQSWSSK